MPKFKFAMLLTNGTWIYLNDRAAMIHAHDVVGDYVLEHNCPC